MTIPTKWIQLFDRLQINFQYLVTGLTSKQDTISDIGSIRINANNALKFINNAIEDYTYIDNLPTGIYEFTNVSNQYLPITTNASGVLVAYRSEQVCIINEKMYYRQKDATTSIYNNWVDNAITIDSALSTRSEKPLQNRVITNALNDKQDKSNLVTSLSASSTDTQYPSAKCVYDLVGDIESALNAINSGVSS